jgi:SAM-dependent methyltransferase
MAIERTPTAVIPDASTPASDELWDLQNLARARRLGDWMFEQFSSFAAGEVVEVGAGIGTFSERLLAAGAESMLLVEPEASCAQALRSRFGADPRVEVAEGVLPASAALCARAGRADFVVCQNVLEHIDDDGGTVAAMAAALRPGGHMTLLVPAHPRLYNRLDRTYDHHRRYTRERLAGLVDGAGLELDELYSFNLLGVPGWWLKGFRQSPGIDTRSLRTYEALLRAWKPIERRVRLPWGLSLIAHATRPT